MRTPRFRLIFHPWGRSVGSEPVKALFLISLELFGVPDHAWHRSAAKTLLSLFCKIEHLASETRDMSDMSVFKLAAWTINPDAIPRSSELLVQDDDAVDLDVDPDRAERFALGLARFPVCIHVASCLDYRHPSPPPPPPPSVNDAGSGPSSPPLPPRWPQQHDFPPAQLNYTRPPPRRDGHLHGRRRAHAPPPCRVSAGILGAHDGSLAPFDWVPARQRLGSAIDTVLPRQRARPDSPPRAAEAHPSTPVLSCGAQEVGDVCDSNAPIADVPSSPCPEDHAVAPLPSTPVSNCHPTTPSDPAPILLGPDWMAGSALDAPPGVAQALDAAPVVDRAPGGDVHDPVTSPVPASILSLHGVSPATPRQEPCMVLVLLPAATPPTPALPHLLLLRSCHPTRSQLRL
ncbi:hypothetical protein D1007_00264 [Hordeum vulgare]|nr:hypothetical protein D1007_00264 [Hordeum vulgare]